VRLAVPDLLDYSHDNDSLYARFTNAGRSLLYPDVSIEHYYEHLTGAGISFAALTVDQLKAHRLSLTNEYGDVRSSYTIFKSLLFDTSTGKSGRTYYLNEGHWYEVDSSYVEGLQARLDPHWVDLPFLGDCSHDLEGDYNAAVGDRAGFVCLDKTNVSPKGQTSIEPCDIYTVTDGKATLIHVKISTGSSLLSHLFNQGTNSVELLKSEDNAPERLIARIRDRANETTDVGALIAPVRTGNYAVVFAIITRKDAAGKSLNLPLFSRISLARNVKALHRVMNVPVSFGFIKHTAPLKPPKPKSTRRGQPSAAS
jgi:uncharacterized protein (TIGR04141 family)